MLNTSSIDILLYKQRMEYEERERRERYKRNWSYYNGSHRQPLPIREGQPDDNVIINLARLIVDKGASFLFGKEVAFELQEGGTTPEEERLAEVWQRNRKMTTLGKWGVTGGIYGHLFVKVVPDGIADGIPRLISIEPEYVSVLWDDQDIDDVLAYVIQWTGQDAKGQGIHRKQEISKDDSGVWQIENRIARVGAGNAQWQPDPDNPDLIWGWPWPPMIDCQNIALPGAYYGLSDLEDLSEQDAINYLASKMQRIIRYHAHPMTFGTGFKPQDMGHAEDEITILPSAEAKVWNLELQSDLASSMGFMDRLINWFLATARIPRLDPATVNVGALSGFALKILYGDLLEKTEIKRRTYGDMLIELNRRLLDIMGLGDEHITTLHWPDPLPEDYAAQEKRDKFEADYELVSKETLRTRRGLDADTERERLAAEEAESGNIGAALVRNWQTAQGTLQQQGQAEIEAE